MWMDLPCTRPPLARGLALALVIAALAGVPAASAAILIPTTTADSFDGACDAQCSLRDAFAAANSTPGADVIVLGPGTWTLSRAGAGEDATATGDLDVTGELSIVGAGAVQTVIDGASLDRVLDVAPGASVEIRGVTIRNGSAADDGGAIRNRGTLLLDRSLVTVSSSRDGSGGGIFSDGELTVTASTISHNTARQRGGGIAADDTLALVNVTISNNTAGSGGGLFTFDEIEATIDNATISANAAVAQGGGVFVQSTPFITANLPTFSNTIIAGNTAPDQRDCFGSPISGGHNLVGDGSGCLDFRPAAGDLEGVAGNPLDPELGFSSSASSPTPVFVPLPGSPAIDAGSPAAPGSAGACAETDQRGEPRPFDGDDAGAAVCDIGAVEVTDGCTAGANTLCLGEDRFRVTARFRSQATAPLAQANAFTLTDDSGYFWFFDPANVEIVVKVLDACAPPFNRFWVFSAGVTNVEVELTVVDTETGIVKVYTNPLNRTFRSILDTNAFATCTP